MPDINLLKDTKEAEERAKKKLVKQPRIEMTDPAKEKKKDEFEKKAPSSFSLFFKSLFSPRPKVKKTPEKLTPEAAEAKLNGEPIMDEGKVITIPPISAKIKEEPEDIFEEKGPKDIYEKKEIKNIRDILTEREKTTSAKIEKKIKSDFSESIKPQELEKKDRVLPPLKAREPSSFLVNLLPEELAGEGEPRQKLINLGIITLSVVIFIGLIYGGMIWYQSGILSKTQDIKTQRSEIDAKINQYRAVQKEAINLKQETDTVKNLLDKHIYWTKFFGKLEKYIIDDVYLTGSFTGSTSSDITLSAIGKNFDAVANQLVVLQNAPDFVKSVSITSAARTGEDEAITPGASASQGVSFTINIKLADNIFYKTEGELTNQNSNLNINANLNTNSGL